MLQQRLQQRVPECWLHLSSYLCAPMHAHPRARARARVSRFLELSDVLCPNESELALLCKGDIDPEDEESVKAGARELIGRGTTTAVLLPSRVLDVSLSYFQLCIVFLVSSSSSLKTPANVPPPDLPPTGSPTPTVLATASPHTQYPFALLPNNTHHTTPQPHPKAPKMWS